MTFRRTPTQRGNTDVPIVAVPRIVGTVRRDSSGDMPIVVTPGEIFIEVDGLPGTPVSASVTLGSTKLNDIITAINTNGTLSGFVLAEDLDGCLSVSTKTSGEGGYVRILPAAPLTDAAKDLGFYTYPHPQSEVIAGSVESSEVRPDTQANPAGTTMLPVAADRLSRSFNRALTVLGRNADHTHTQVTNPVALPVEILVDLDGAWALRTVAGPTPGTIAQLDLTALTRADAGLPLLPDPSALIPRIWVGNLSNTSSLGDISKYFKVLDENNNEIIDPASGEIVRVAAVTRGSCGSAYVPAWSPAAYVPGAEWQSVSFLLDSTATASPFDGLNVLGVDLVKVGPAAISEVLGDRSTVYVSGATFVTNGVVAGDVAVISGSGVTSPKSNNGTYYVETVVDEEHLVLRPADPEDSGDLAPGSSPAPGNIVVSSGGQFQDNIFLTLYPPLSPVADKRAGYHFKVVLGVERSVSELEQELEIPLKVAVAPLSGQTYKWDQVVGRGWVTKPSITVTPPGTYAIAGDGVAYCGGNIVPVPADSVTLTGVAGYRFITWSPTEGLQQQTSYANAVAGQRIIAAFAHWDGAAVTYLSDVYYRVNSFNKQITATVANPASSIGAAFSSIHEALAAAAAVYAASSTEQHAFTIRVIGEVPCDPISDANLIMVPNVTFKGDGGVDLARTALSYNTPVVSVGSASILRLTGSTLVDYSSPANPPVTTKWACIGWRFEDLVVISASGTGSADSLIELADGTPFSLSFDRCGILCLNQNGGMSALTEMDVATHDFLLNVGAGATTGVARKLEISSCVIATGFGIYHSESLRDDCTLTVRDTLVVAGMGGGNITPSSSPAMIEMDALNTYIPKIRLHSCDMRAGLAEYGRNAALGTKVDTQGIVSVPSAVELTVLNGTYRTGVDTNSVPAFDVGGGEAACKILFDGAHISHTLMGSAVPVTKHDAALLRIDVGYLGSPYVDYSVRVVNCHIDSPLYSHSAVGDDDVPCVYVVENTGGSEGILIANNRIRGPICVQYLPDSAAGAGPLTVSGNQLLARSFGITIDTAADTSRTFTVAQNTISLVGSITGSPQAGIASLLAAAVIHGNHISLDTGAAATYGIFANGYLSVVSANRVTSTEAQGTISGIAATDNTAVSGNMVFDQNIGVGNYCSVSGNHAYDCTTGTDCTVTGNIVGGTIQTGTNSIIVANKCSTVNPTPALGEEIAHNI